MLLDAQTYRNLSGDTTNSDDTVVGNAIAASQSLLEQFLRRDGCLEYGVRTENVRLHPDGRAYPKATPIASVSSPASAVIQDTTAVLGLPTNQNPLFDILIEPYLYGPGGPGGYFDTTMPFSTITYAGGYTITTLPRKLRQALVDLTQVELTVFNPAAAGVRQATVGDVSVVYTNPPDRAGIVDAILNTVRGFKRREIGH